MTPIQGTGGLAGDALGAGPGPEPERGRGPAREAGPDTGRDPGRDPGPDAGTHAGPEAEHPAEQEAEHAAEQEAELHAGFLAEAAHWMHGLFGPADRATAAVRRILDVGSGPGVASHALADAFPEAHVVAVDRSAALLARAEARAAEHGLAGRISTRRADRPEEFARSGPVDLIWTGNVCRHLGDQQAALRSLASALRPGGLLAVAERGLPPRFLPRDIGIGRPGLQARLDAAVEEQVTARRSRLPGATSVVEDWPCLLASAGLVPAGTRTFLIEFPAPLDLPVRRHLHTRLHRLLADLGDRLDLVDRLTVEQLLDGDACTGVLWRPDAFYLTAVTVHTARLCRPRAAD
ncbi:trans-aconitate 2-methyltransferase [Streptomyces lateritius]|uniref:class I SAM-dependent methyltransferase n=1 Tax=Streptomyces lateritius TaxID=67313 RepID=UPI001C8B5470|nr:methyltransferase domain-containing protein [Streptomyces lateritius]MBX9426794.1 methyltransferase domain-containing protein [Streptomyces lateritius]